MKKILSFVLCLTLTLPLLFACGSGGTRGGTTTDVLGDDAKSFSTYYNTPLLREGSSGYTKVKDIGLPSGASGVTAGGNFLYYRESNDTLRVFSSKAGKYILSVPGTEKVSVNLSEDYVCLLKTASGTQTTEVYGYDGTLLVSVSGHHPISQSDMGFTLDDKLYRIEDGKLKKTYTVPPFISTGSYYFVGNYVIRKDSYKAVYYNESFKAIGHYEIPENADGSGSMFILENGNLLVQYRVLCDPNASSYDHIEKSSGGVCKYILHTLLYNPDTDETTKLDLDVAISTVYNQYSSRRISANFDFDEIFTDKVDNVLCYMTIEDGILNRQLYFVTLSNDGEVGDRLDNFLEDQTTLIYPLENGTYVAPTETGYALLNENGKVTSRLAALGTATGFGYQSLLKIYDLNMKLVIDLSSLSYSDYSVHDNVVYYEKTVDGSICHFVFTKEGERQITAPEGYTVKNFERADNYYIVTYHEKGGDYSEDYCALYSLNGTLLLSYSEYNQYGYYAGATVVCETDAGMILKHTDLDTGEVRYTSFSK